MRPLRVMRTEYTIEDRVQQIRQVFSSSCLIAKRVGGQPGADFSSQRLDKGRDFAHNGCEGWHCHCRRLSRPERR